MGSNLKSEILLKSKGGLLFYQLAIGDKLIAENEKRFRNVKNPLYKDKNPSLSIYQNNKGKWDFERLW